MIGLAFRRVRGSWRNLDRLRVPRHFRLLAVFYLVEYFTRMALLGLQIRFGPHPKARPERLTVIVPAYGRLENLAPIVRSALCLPFLDRIIVVNGNPDARVAEWIPEDPRVVPIDDHGSGVGVRFSVASDHPADYYITFDDDMIPRPTQIARLFGALVEDPEVTHGMIGVRYTGSDERPFEFGIRGREESVDLLNGCHAFTRQHLERYHELLEALDLPPSREVHNGEDIVMSAAGAGQPRVHRLGRWIQCPSTIDPTVAIHLRRPGFRTERLELFRRARTVARHGE
ncbi:MAG: glycosyltransferase family 2 protein [Planctomycetota bacterium]